MNRNQFNRKSESSARKPFCKVCYDAGKPESEYTNHYVKSLPDKRTGKCNTTCPTLLNLECRYCYGHGHTTKYCPVLEERKKTEAKIVKDQEKDELVKEKQKPIPAKSQNILNIYNILNDSDDESADEQKPKKVEEFPALGEPSVRIFSYANAAAKKPEPAKQAEQLPSGFQVLKTGDQIKKTEGKKDFNFRFTNWAAYSDDEDDDEDDEKVETAW